MFPMKHGRFQFNWSSNGFYGNIPARCLFSKEIKSTKLN